MSTIKCGVTMSHNKTYLIPIIFLLLFACGPSIYELGQQAQQRRENYVKTHLNLNQEIKYAILKGEPRLGMSPDEVMAILGEPRYKSWSISYKHGYIVIFGYKEKGFFGDSHYFIFKNNILTEID